MGVNTVLSLTNFTERRLRVLYILFERSEFLIDTSQKKSLRVCTCARVHVCNNLGFSVWYYVPHTYVPGISSLSAGCQDTYMYICARVGYVLCATYVRKLVWARLFVPGISRLPRYVYVDTYVPGLHPRPKKRTEGPAQAQGATHAQRDSHCTARCM